MPVQNQLIEHYQWFNLDAIRLYLSEKFEWEINIDSLKELFHHYKMPLSFRIVEDQLEYRRIVEDVDDFVPFEPDMDCVVNDSEHIQEISVVVERVCQGEYLVHDSPFILISKLNTIHEDSIQLTIEYTHDVDLRLDVIKYGATHSVDYCQKAHNTFSPLTIPLKFGEIGLNRAELEDFSRLLHDGMGAVNVRDNTRSNPTNKPEYFIVGSERAKHLHAQNPNIKRDIAAQEIAEYLNQKNIKNARGGKITPTLIARHVCTPLGLWNK